MFKTMKTIRLNISEAKTHLSKYARLVKKGGRIILCDRNKPFAEIRPLTETSSKKRPFGLHKDLISVPEDFNDPDPELEALFYGDAEP